MRPCPALRGAPASAAALPCPPWAAGWRAARAHACRGAATATASSTSTSASTSASASTSSSCAEPIPRRAALLAAAAALQLVARQRAASAATEAQDVKLPKAYVECVNRVVKSLREAIEAEQGDGKEAEIRRKADPAKEALQVFVKRWRDDSKVAGHPSHVEIKAVLLELGRFYQTAGPRARMPTDVQERLLGMLAAAEGSLKPIQPGSRTERSTPASLFDGTDDLRELLPTR